ncbi:MAG: FAD-dependent thymidylate synthase [archaeon GB-1867-097]|nr:FAD-dependent thymidylate synthase [Candidatus Culexmicrobium thermophilum]MCS7384118.1 FAD-dependent thymidylate synthase [Candidatus Culexmicrobium thermophilum]
MIGVECALRVILLSYTPNPERVVASAIRQCRSIKGADQIYSELSEEDVKRLIRSCIRQGHLSPIEHASFTFLIEGISRVASHQLVRHRIASYSQQSHRVVDLSSIGFVIPPTISDSPEAENIFKNLFENARKCYLKLLELGVPREDARYIIPQAVETSIVVTMNARELLHFFKLRLAKDSQWEIRRIARRMLSQVYKVAPTIFEQFKEHL